MYCDHRVKKILLCTCRFVRRGAKLVSRVMGNTVGAASKQQSSAQDGDESRSASHTFDLSSLDGWSSATNCFSLHVAGCVQCTCVQVQVPVASLGSRKYKALLSRDQLEDPRAVAQFSGEMQQSGMLKVTVSLGSEGPLEPSSSVAIRELGTPDVSEELFTCIYQEMEGLPFLFDDCSVPLHTVVVAMHVQGSSCRI